MIKTYPDRAAHDAAVKSEMESTVALIENVNETVIDGVNAVVDQPGVGDIVCRDENRKIKFIALDTFHAGMFPTAWETIGVVALRRGNELMIVSKENASQKWMDVYPYVVTGYELDGTEHTAQLRLHGKPTTSTYYEFKYTASTVDEFVTALQQFLTTNSETDWSAYKDTDGRVILQYDNYTTAEYYTATITQATGLTLTGRVTLDVPEAAPSFLRECGTRGYGVWNAARAKVYFRTDSTNTSYNPTSPISSMPSYPICWPGFAGISEHRDGDNCLWLRQQYCADPEHPTEAEWEAYIDDICLKVPAMTGGAGIKWRDGKAVTDSLKDITYLAADGTRKPLYPAARYCSQFFGGEGFLPSAPQFYELMKDATYGLSGVTRDKADPVNRSLYAIGGSALGVTSSWWLCLRNGAAYACYANGTGYVVSSYFCISLRCAPLSLLTLPEAAD